MTEVHPVLSHCEILEWEYNEHEHQLSGVKKLGNMSPNAGKKITLFSPAVLSASSIAIQPTCIQVYTSDKKM